MSFTFGNDLSCKIGNIEHMINTINQENGNSRQILKEKFLNEWHCSRALIIDFAKLGLDPNNLPAPDLSDCSIDYEFADEGHIVFRTIYKTQEALNKDIEFINIAKQHGACRQVGLSVAITMDKNTGMAFRHALIKTRK